MLHLLPPLPLDSRLLLLRPPLRLDFLLLLEGGLFLAVCLLLCEGGRVSGERGTGLCLGTLASAGGLGQGNGFPSPACAF